MPSINIKATNMELTEALRNYVGDKIAHLDKHAAVAPINTDVELEHFPAHHSGPIFRCEIMYTMPGDGQVLRAEATEADMYAAIDVCLPKIKEQLDKSGQKHDALVRRGGRKLKEMMRRFWE